MASPMQALVPEAGSISFDDFKAAAQEAGVKIELWHRAKRVGEFRTYTTTDGEVRLTRESAVQPEELVVWPSTTQG